MRLIAVPATPTSNARRGYAVYGSRRRIRDAYAEGFTVVTAQDAGTLGDAVAEEQLGSHETPTRVQATTLMGDRRASIIAASREEPRTNT